MQAALSDFDTPICQVDDRRSWPIARRDTVSTTRTIIGILPLASVIVLSPFLKRVLKALDGTYLALAILAVCQWPELYIWLLCAFLPEDPEPAVTPLGNPEKHGAEIQRLEDVPKRLHLLYPILIVSPLGSDFCYILKNHGMIGISLIGFRLRCSIELPHTHARLLNRGLFIMICPATQQLGLVV